MKKVLAELHSLINDLEDQGLTAEASSLQDVFVRVAQEADENMDDSDAEQEVEDDLANDVAGLLKSHSAAEVLAEIAKQMGNDDTSEMAFRGYNKSRLRGFPDIRAIQNDLAKKPYPDYGTRRNLSDVGMSPDDMHPDQGGFDDTDTGTQDYAFGDASDGSADEMREKLINDAYKAYMASGAKLDSHAKAAEINRILKDSFGPGAFEKVAPSDVMGTGWMTAQMARELGAPTKPKYPGDSPNN